MSLVVHALIDLKRFPVLLGDFNFHLEKPQAADFHSLLASFDLKRVTIHSVTIEMLNSQYKYINSSTVITTWHEVFKYFIGSL